MPLPLSSIAIQEKNKIANSDSVFLLLAEIIIPGLPDPIRVVANTEDLAVENGTGYQWRGQDWIAFPFEIDEINESDSGEVPRVEIKVGNVNREIEFYLHEYDRYCKINGHVPVVCHLYVINTLNVGSNDPEVHHEFELVQPKTSSQWATFVLGASNPFNRRFPQRRMIPACGWKFKDFRCGYSGSALNCNKSFARCKQLGNSRRFGGFYATKR